MMDELESYSAHVFELGCMDQRVYLKSDADKEIHRLRREVWLARAKRALDKIAWFKLWNCSISTMDPEDSAKQEWDKWKKNLGKFLKRAEEYK